MKNILILALSVCVFLQIGNSQTFDCPMVNPCHTVEVGIPSCENNGSFDYILVTLSVTGLDNACSGSITINGLPEDVSVNGNPIITEPFFYVPANGDFNFSIPSDGCAPVNYSVSFLTQVATLEMCEYSDLILAIPPTIPTLGQWGLILLSLTSMLFGVLYLRKRIIQEAINN